MNQLKSALLAYLTTEWLVWPMTLLGSCWTARNLGQISSWCGNGGIHKLILVSMSTVRAALFCVCVCMLMSCLGYPSKRGKTARYICSGAKWLGCAGKVVMHVGRAVQYKRQPRWCRWRHYGACIVLETKSAVLWWTGIFSTTPC